MDKDTVLKAFFEGTLRGVFMGIVAFFVSILLLFIVLCIICIKEDKGD